MDCTHVRITSPVGDHAEIFRNRKIFLLMPRLFAMQIWRLLLIMLQDGRGRAMTAPFLVIAIEKQFDSGDYGDALLLVDGGYASTFYTMPPLENPRTPLEQLYNESQIRSKNPVERSYGIWKRRFAALSLGLRIKLDKVLVVIISTAVLHNILREQGEEVPPDNLELLLKAPWQVLLQDGQMENDPPRTSQRHTARDLLINSYFRNFM